MKKYETIVVFDPKLSDTDVKGESDKIVKIIQDKKGSEVVIDNWGKRELPYLMKKNKMGNYVVFYFQSDVSETVDEIQSQLRISEPVIKFQTHRIHDRMRKFRGRATGDAEAAA